MGRPREWVRGLLPLAALFLIAGFWHQGVVEQDIGRRGNAVLAAAGLDWAKVELSGRDAGLTGEAPSPEARAQAVAAAEKTFGLRRANDRMGVLPEAKPFTFTAMRDGTKITLTGSVPPGTARIAVVDAARKIVPEMAIVDELKPARGAVPEFAALAAYGIAELGKLSQGTLSVSDNAVSLTGRAADFGKFTEIRARLAALPVGGKLTRGLAAGDILPPVAKPFVFAAERSASSLVLTGFVPSEEARTRITAEARALGLPVRDALLFADGAPAGDWPGAAAMLMRELAKLETGKVALSDDKASITGKARDLITESDVRAALRTLPSGYPLVQVAIESRVIRPYVFKVLRGDGSVSLTGFVPDAKTKADILDASRRFFEGERVEDKLIEGLGAPGDFVVAIRAGLQGLSRLANGAELSIADGAIALKGAVLFEFAREQVAAEFARGLPASFRGSAQLGVVPLPPPITLSRECQLEYNALLARGTVRFKSGSADLSDESRAIVDRLTLVSLRCVNARIEIGGHTDTDGSAQSNAELSRRRSETVGAYMVRVGVPVERLEPVGYGQTVPVAPNDTADNKAKNRRIEFIVK